MDSMFASNSIHPLLKNGTSNPMPNSPSSSHLSWQSALWALVTIALNTMTQSSTSSNFLFSEPFSLLRASPIICLADLLFMLLWVAKLTLFSHERLGLLEAMRCFRRETELEKKKERVSVLTIVLFILGPLPQFIKLNACSGIYWTLTWSWIYMLCYVFSVLSIMCDRGDEDDHHLLRAGTALSSGTKSLLKRISYWIYGLAYAAQTTFAFWLVGKGLYTQVILGFVGKALNVVVSLYVLMFAPILLSMGFLILVGFIRDTDEAIRPGLRWLIILVCLILTAACLYAESHISSFPVILEVSPDPFTTWSWLLLLGFVFCFVVGGYILVNYIAERIGPDLRLTLRRFPRRHSLSATSSSQPAQHAPRAESQSKSGKDEVEIASWQSLFATAMLILALSYYWQIYDPSDTVKPAWVDVFG